LESVQGLFNKLPEFPMAGEIYIQGQGQVGGGVGDNAGEQVFPDNP
jgi:hypothetical protein